MKQKYIQHFLLIFLMLGQASVVSAQSLQLLNTPGVTYGSESTYEYEIPLDVQNIGTTTIEVIAKRESESMAPNHVTFFCWEECYTPAVIVGAPVTIAPGEIITLFKSYVQPNNTSGISSVRYSFYNVDDITDSVQYTFVYNLGVVSALSDLERHIGKPYPNPANDNVSIDLNLPAGISPTVEIVNVIGRTIQSAKAKPQQEKVTFNTSSLAPGVYFIRTTAGNDTVKVQKFTKF